MFWTIIIAIIGFIMFQFFNSLSKDSYDLQGKSLDEKFKVVVNMINDAAFSGRGSVRSLDKREFNLYEEGQNQIIKFQYSTGHLTIIWKYKYFQKEVIHQRQFNDVRNISLFDQQKIAERMIREMTDVVERHKNNVIGSI